MSKIKQLQIREFHKDMPVKVIDVTGKSERQVDKIDRGLNINLDHNRFYTLIVEAENLKKTKTSTDKRIQEILDSGSLEERLAGLLRVMDVEHWKDGEYLGDNNRVARVLAEEVKKWMDTGTGPLFKQDK